MEYEGSGLGERKQCMRHTKLLRHMFVIREWQMDEHGGKLKVAVTNRRLCGPLPPLSRRLYRT